MLNLQQVRDYVGGKSVALVGNALSLRGKRSGDLIDAHDIVVRFNMGFPELDTAEDFGKRMDVWAGIRGWGDDPPRGNPRAYPKPILSLGGWNDKVDQLWVVPWARRSVLPALQTRTYVLTGEWAAASQQIGVRATSGFTVCYMLATCAPSEVDLYGFDFFVSRSRVNPRPEALDPKNKRKRRRERAWILQNTPFRIW